MKLGSGFGFASETRGVTVERRRTRIQFRRALTTMFDEVIPCGCVKSACAGQPHEMRWFFSEIRQITPFPKASLWSETVSEVCSTVLTTNSISSLLKQLKETLPLSALPVEHPRPNPTPENDKTLRNQSKNVKRDGSASRTNQAGKRRRWGTRGRWRRRRPHLIKKRRKTTKGPLRFEKACYSFKSHHFHLKRLASINFKATVRCTFSKKKLRR